MYLYFDVNGNLKEFINRPVREGNDNVNKIYVYIEPSTNQTVTIDAEDYEDYNWESEPTEDSVNVFVLPTIYSTWQAAFKTADGEVTPIPLSGTIESSAIIKQIPYDKERDLKFFKYFKYYQFIEITLTSDITQYNGRCDCTVSLIDLESDPQVNVKLDTFSFFIQSSVVIKDPQITTAQYEYLIAQVDAIEEGMVGQFVPYTGATENVNLGVYSLLFGSHDEFNGIKENNNDILMTSYAGDIVLGADGYVYIDSKTENNKVVVKSDLSDFVTSSDLSDYALSSDLADYLPLAGGDMEGDINLGNYGVGFTGGLIYVDGNADMHVVSARNVVLVPDVKAYVYDATTDNEIAVKGDLSDYVTLATNQEITGNKEFTGDVSVGEGSFYIENDDNSYKTELKQASTMTGNRTIELPNDDGTVALTKQLPTQGICATFSTSDFTLDTDHYVISNVAVSNFITGSNMLIITWDNCFALCPIPQTGAGRVCAAMWNADGESQIIRIKYELKTNNTLLDISLSGGFVPPSGHTAYVQCIKLF